MSVAGRCVDQRVGPEILAIVTIGPELSPVEVIRIDVVIW